MSMNLPSALKCQASFLRQILQPAIVNKLDLRVGVTFPFCAPQNILQAKHKQFNAANAAYNSLDLTCLAPSVGKCQSSHHGPEAQETSP